MDVASSSDAGKSTDRRADRRDRRVAELRACLRERDRELAALARRLQGFETGTDIDAQT
jgi:predicted RNase H-like nuclease (RuvC/YqgF family)